MRKIFKILTFSTILLGIFLILNPVNSRPSIISGIYNQVLATSVADAQKKPTESDQVLTTTVQDPKHPDEPWTVTTYRRPDESIPAFIRRHKETVDGVREVLTS